jgi:hypothetical protein
MEQVQSRNAHACFLLDPKDIGDMVLQNVG